MEDRHGSMAARGIQCARAMSAEESHEAVCNVPWCFCTEVRLYIHSTYGVTRCTMPIPNRVSGTPRLDQRCAISAYVPSVFQGVSLSRASTARTVYFAVW